MGMKESIIVNFESKTLEYQNKKFYILKQFEFEGKTYLYGIDVDEFYKNQRDLEVVFLYRVHDDIFNHVSDEKLLVRLQDYVAGICTIDLMQENMKNKSNN